MGTDGTATLKPATMKSPPKALSHNVPQLVEPEQRAQVTALNGGVPLRAISWVKEVRSSPSPTSGFTQPPPPHSFVHSLTERKAKGAPRGIRNGRPFASRSLSSASERRVTCVLVMG